MTASREAEVVERLRGVVERELGDVGHRDEVRPLRHDHGDLGSERGHLVVRRVVRITLPLSTVLENSSGARFTVKPAAVIAADASAYD